MHEVEPDNYFNPGTPVADFRVDSDGVAEVLTDRSAPTITQQSRVRGDEPASDDGMIVVWGEAEYPF